ncbi:hypothetical protein VP03_21830, partial [Sinorhizobium meliloti]|uniref:hypothetical protein n=1 Tax=Rhizobium meliloti TaxID=382 RepID=UPI00061496FE
NKPAGKFGPVFSFAVKRLIDVLKFGIAPPPNPLPAGGERGLERCGISLLPAGGEKVPAGG